MEHGVAASPEEPGAVEPGALELGQAIEHFRAGHLQAALTQCQQIIARDPQCDEALHLLGVVQLKLGDAKSAEATLRLALSLKQRPEFLVTLGLAQRMLGDGAGAESSYRQAIALSPGAIPDAHNNLGNLLASQGRMDEAMREFHHTLKSDPAHLGALDNLGQIQRLSGDVAGAISSFRRLAAAAAQSADALFKLANALYAHKEVDEAIALYAQVTKLAPGHGDAHRNLAVLQESKGRIRLAIESFKRVVALTPNDADMAIHLITLKQGICEWDSWPEDEAKLKELALHATSRTSPRILFSIPSSPREQRDCAQKYASQWQATAKPFIHKSTSHSVIRIGYLSDEFREHATSFLLGGLIRAHDRTRFTVSGYCYGQPDRSDTRAAIAKEFDRFVDVHKMTDLEVAQQIYRDQIDILMDLKGYQFKSRTGILAHRPAPIQVNFLGYPGTMGADFMDYIIADRHVAPLEWQPFFSEKIIHLPHSYQANGTLRRQSSHRPSRTECGLPNDGFIFCCFNTSHKINPTMFHIWMRLLAQTPGSVLWLLDCPQEAQENLRLQAQHLGVDGSRLIFAPFLALDRHLARLSLADLSLDTLPCGAHTTASDALWAGVPVLTCVGETFAGRVGASLLHAVGLPDMVTHALDDYERLALKLATEPSLLAAIRSRLSLNKATHPLFDINLYAKNLEAAFGQMYQSRMS